MAARTRAAPDLRPPAGRGPRAGDGRRRPPQAAPRGEAVARLARRRAAQPRAQDAPHPRPGQRPGTGPGGARRGGLGGRRLCARRDAAAARRPRPRSAAALSRSRRPAVLRGTAGARGRCAAAGAGRDGAHAPQAGPRDPARTARCRPRRPARGLAGRPAPAGLDRSPRGAGGERRSRLGRLGRRLARGRNPDGNEGEDDRGRGCGCTGGAPRLVDGLRTDRWTRRERSGVRGGFGGARKRARVGCGVPAQRQRDEAPGRRCGVVAVCRGHRGARSPRSRARRARVRGRSFGDARGRRPDRGGRVPLAPVVGPVDRAKRRAHLPRLDGHRGGRPVSRAPGARRVGPATGDGGRVRAARVRGRAGRRASRRDPRDGRPADGRGDRRGRPRARGRSRASVPVAGPVPRRRHVPGGAGQIRRARPLCVRRPAAGRRADDRGGAPRPRFAHVARGARARAGRRHDRDPHAAQQHPDRKGDRRAHGRSDRGRHGRDRLDAGPTGDDRRRGALRAAGMDRRGRPEDRRSGSRLRPFRAIRPPGHDLRLRPPAGGPGARPRGGSGGRARGRRPRRRGRQLVGHRRSADQHGVGRDRARRHVRNQRPEPRDAPHPRPHGGGVRQGPLRRRSGGRGGRSPRRR